MFIKCEDGIFFEVHKGVSRKVTAHGDNMFQYKYYLEKGAIIPRREHPRELTGYLVSGHLQLVIDGKSHRVEPGDSWYVPAQTEYGAEALENSVMIEVFCPVKEDGLAGMSDWPVRAPSII